MTQQDKVWAYKVFVILASAALSFGIWSRLSLAISAKVAREKAHLSGDIVLTRHLRPSTYIFSDGSQVDIGGGFEALSGFTAFIVAVVAVCFFWWVLAGTLPQLHRAAFPRNDRNSVP